MAEGKRPRSPSLGLQVGKKGQWDGDFINPVGSAGALEAVDGGGHGLLSSLLVQRPATGSRKQHGSHPSPPLSWPKAKRLLMEVDLLLVVPFDLP